MDYSEETYAQLYVDVIQVRHACVFMWHNCRNACLSVAWLLYLLKLFMLQLTFSNLSYIITTNLNFILQASFVIHEFIRLMTVSYCEDLWCRLFLSRYDVSGRLLRTFSFLYAKWKSCAFSGQSGGLFPALSLITILFVVFMDQISKPGCGEDLGTSEEGAGLCLK